ncbi:pentapeptide repeat-containing protein [Chloroflexota bacterium]
MGDGTEQNPYTREDVLELIEANKGKDEKLDLSGKWFGLGIDLRERDSGGHHIIRRDLRGIILKKAIFISKFDGANWVGANLEKVDLRHAHLEGADLSHAHLEDTRLGSAHFEGADLASTYLEKANLSKTHLEGAYLKDAKFSADTRLEEAVWGNYKIGEENKKDFDSAESIYRRLKVWYTQSGHHDTAAKFYYREKEANRKSLKLFSKSCRHRIALQLSYWVFGHGEGWKRLLFGWIAGVIFALAAVYYFWGSFCSASFWDTLYYSATSFSALGYGNWAPQPTGWAKGMGAVEAIIGVFMMALLLVTFVRKWTR